jgi:3-isopropylmalate/(R)-2-methylmalate dehydratase small subunit
MRPFTTHTGLAAPLDRVNVDTDAIIPKQFLKRIERTGFGPFLFSDWRYLADGKPNPEFVLNKPEFKGASVLLCRANFGCGSSREHAPWALEDFGVKALIGPSFADIFFNNCFKNGMLPIVLPESVVDGLFARAANGALRLSIDLNRQTIAGPEGLALKFDVDPFRKECLLNGWDDIGLSLRHEPKIAAYEAAAR